MIGLEVIKQSFENNKKGINTNLLKKIASLKIEEKFQNCLSSYSIISIIERITESRIDEENKKTLMKILKDGLNKTVGEMENSVKELFYSKQEKEASVEDEENKEDEDSNKEANNSEDKDENSNKEEDEKEASVAQSYFNY